MSERKRNRSYWMIVLGSTVLTVVALFGLQEWHRTYMLISTGGLGTEVGAEVEALNTSHREALASGRMPIDRAMRLMVERGRTASALVVPQSSTDPGPASGWLHHPDYEAPPSVPEEPPAPEPVAPPEGPTEEGTTPIPQPQPAPQPQPEAAQ